MSNQIVLLNYGAGNMASVRNALDHINVSFREVDSVDQSIDPESVFLLPGVGSFSIAYQELKARNMLQVLIPGSKILGICLGMQLLFTEGNEGGLSSGLNLIPGNISLISNHTSWSDSIRLPHVGWESLRLSSISNSYPFLRELNDYYFVHSYMAFPSSSKYILASSNYNGIDIPAIVANNSVVGFQFHPEKSGPAGLSLFSNALKWLQAL